LYNTSFDEKGGCGSWKTKIGRRFGDYCHSECSEESGYGRQFPQLCHSEERALHATWESHSRPVILSGTTWSEESGWGRLNLLICHSERSEPTPRREQKELCSFCRDAKEEDRRSRIWLGMICPFVLSFRTYARNLRVIISSVLSCVETPTVGTAFLPRSDRGVVVQCHSEEQRSCDVGISFP